MSDVATHRELLETDSRSTKRDLYYQNVSWFTAQKELDDIVSLGERNPAGEIVCLPLTQIAVHY
jgi:DNA topoisomerase VI subunit A